MFEALGNIIFVFNSGCFHCCVSFYCYSDDLGDAFNLTLRYYSFIVSVSVAL
jgi:hypothetical protein